MSLKTRRRVVVARIETVEGTAETITVADAGIVAFEAKWDPDFKQYSRDNVATASLSKLPNLPGQKAASISFRAEMKGPGAVYSATVKPALSPYLKACGFAETVDITSGSEKVTYLPASTGIPSLTIWLYEDGIIRKIKGARGTVSFSGKAGEPVIAEFKFTGVHDGSPAGAMIAPTLEATIPPVLLNSTLTLDAFAPVFETISFDMGNEIQMRGDANSATGYRSALLTDRKPTAKLDPEMELPATFDFMGKWESGATFALAMGPIGSVNYNRFTISAPKVGSNKVGEGDRGGLQTADLDCKLTMNTGDDELKIEFVK